MTTERTLPQELERAIGGVFGEAGTAWVKDLSQLVRRLELAWGIEVVALLPGLSFNAVYHVRTADSRDAILKLGVPCREIRCEIDALTAYAGRSAVRILASDRDAVALLLERIIPGTTLHAVTDDEQATRIAASVMADLWALPPAQDIMDPGQPSGFPTVQDWGEGFLKMRVRFDGGSGPLPYAVVERAATLFDELAATSAAPLLLHGDLHHGNILCSGELGGYRTMSWVAIDPKGVIGEPAYDVGSFLRNHILHTPDPQTITARRLDIFAETLGIPRRRLQTWAYTQSVLSAWWTIEDGGDGWDDALACAALISEA